MIVIKETGKDFETAVADVAAAVEAKGYGVLYIHDLRAKMKEKGVEFSNACQVLEVCNPKHAATVLGQDMSVAMALPCRISVYEDGGRIYIGTIKPAGLIGMFSDSDALRVVANEVEHDILAILDAAL